MGCASPAFPGGVDDWAYRGCIRVCLFVYWSGGLSQLFALNESKLDIAVMARL